MQVTQVLMTPEMASGILANNKRNRNFREAKSEVIAADIRAGRWMLTPQTISIASNGILLDGQHRLTAIIRSGMAVPVMLATDCPPECFAAIDTGDSRTPGDLLKIEGASNYNYIGAIIRVVYFYNNYPNNVWNHNLGALSKQQLLEIYKSDPAGWASAAKQASANPKTAFLNVTAVGALLYLYSSAKAPRQDDAIAINDYLRLYRTGEMLSNGDPILAFRNWQVANHKIAYVKKPQTQLACHIKAYKYWRDGAQLKCFKVPQVPPMPQL